MKTFLPVLLLVLSFGLFVAELQQRTVETIADIQLLQPVPSKPMVEVLWYHVKGDGGGGLFVYTAGSSYTAERDVVSYPANGDTLYNTTLNKLQTYVSGVWTDLH